MNSDDDDHEHASNGCTERKLAWCCRLTRVSNYDSIDNHEDVRIKDMTNKLREGHAHYLRIYMGIIYTAT